LTLAPGSDHRERLPGSAGAVVNGLRRDPRAQGEAAERGWKPVDASPPKTLPRPSGMHRIPEGRPPGEGISQGPVSANAGAHG
jgi:hypothetical protein